MPIIQVFARPVDGVYAKLEAMCREVADALSLQPDDVVATHLAVSATIVPGAAGAVAAGWPVVVVHGSARPEEQMAAACDRLRTLVAEWDPRGRADGVWVTWQLPT